MDFPLRPALPDADPSLDASVKEELPKELTSHGTTPSGKPRLYMCSICTRAFARMEHLHRHERSHTKEKPFTCGVCQRKFSRRDLLLRHAQKLHAGCSDAITRLRRKLIKNSNLPMAANGMHSSEVLMKDFNESGSNVLVADHYSQPTNFGSQNSISFNLNLFRAKENARSGTTTPLKLSRSSSVVKDQNLQRQIFDHRRLYRSRGASFSAQSGTNYANAVTNHQDSYPADNVEFSTPQLAASTSVDEHSWLSNLSTIPGISSNNEKGPLDKDYSMEDEIPTHTAVLGGGLGQEFFRSEGVDPSRSLDSFSAQGPFVNHADSVTQTGSSVTPKNGIHEDEHGYTFYDIPELMMNAKRPFRPRVTRPLSPIKQEIEDEILELEDNNLLKNQFPAAITEGVNFDLNFLNDMDELTQGFDIGSKFQPNGYSFYGDNPLVSSSGIESTSPPPFMSPSSIHASTNSKKANFIGGNHPLGLGTHSVDLETLLAPKQFHKQKSELQYSTSVLFTKHMRLMINRALSKYPISGIMSPTIPSNDKMELYLKNFKEKFLSHFPFLHISKLNEHEIMAMTSNEDMSNESARVCMPLLVATIGALVSNEKNDSEHLYEASRRAIHIYLESRKNSAHDQEGTPQTVNPLWLIQALTLSVVYGLVSDNENNVYIVIRQLNALNSLVKTSVKGNRDYFFLCHGQEKAQGLGPEAIFTHLINAQSQVRIVLIIYRLTNFILMMYNVPLTLSLNDLANITIPNIYDEFVWQFNDYSYFSAYQRSLETPYDIKYYTLRDENNTIVFKDLLLKLMANDFGPQVVNKLSHMSKYGFITLVQGVFEMKQYDEMKNVDVASILDNVALFLASAKNNGATRYSINSPIDFEKLDCALVINFVKVCSILDFKLVKEQSWLRNYDELTRNYYKMLSNLDCLNDFEKVKLVDCCILLIKYVIFRTDDAQLEISNGKPEIFLTELSVLESGDYLNPFKAMVRELLHHRYNACANFESNIAWKVFDEIDITKNSITLQLLFHVFTILSIFAVLIAKRNNAVTDIAAEANRDYTKQLNHRFIIVMRLMTKIEVFLRQQYQSLCHDNDLTSLYLFLSGNDELLMYSGVSEDANMAENNYFAFKLEKSLYILKLGELMMKYCYDTNIKMSIFKKLSGSLLQIRKFLIDGESMIMQ